MTTPLNLLFLELTQTNGNSITISLTKVLGITPDREGKRTLIFMVGVTFYVSETYEQIKEMLVEIGKRYNA